jgi:RNA polymerase sigma-70 factor (ECF subfamily)
MDPDHTSNDSQSPAPERSDADLVDTVLAGDESAFELLFERHRRRVGLIAGRFFQQPEQIEEILQESFTKAYFALKDFSSYKDDSFTSWLARIAFNSCYDELRRRSRGRESSISDITSTDREALRSLRAGVAGDSLESVAVNRDLANKLLSFLSAEDRLVLVLLDVEGLSVAEIGQLMNWSSPKVKIRVFRARTDLRRVLKKFL